MKFNLPWENLDIVYSYIDKRERKPYVIYIGVVLSILFMIIGIISVYRIGLVIGVVLLLASTMKKYVVITSRGLEIFYNLFLTKSYEIWNWNDINSLTYANDGDRKDLAILYFTKGVKTKRFNFELKDKEKILKLAKDSNKKLKIFDGAKYKEKMRG